MLNAEVHIDIETDFGYFLLVCGKESMANVARFLYGYRVKYQITPAENDDNDFNPYDVDHIRIAIPKNDQIPIIRATLSGIISQLLGKPVINEPKC